MLAGDTYCRRLWCIMEIFSFLAMGGSVGDIILLDVRTKSARHGCGPATPSEGTKRTAETLRVRGGSFRALWRSAAGTDTNEDINLEAAQCTLPDERDRMLGVIEAAYGDISLFEEDLQVLFASTRSSRRWSQEAYSGNVWRRHSDAYSSKRGNSYASRTHPATVLRSRP